jgi:indole-3-glycerol phosphate synthase
MTSYLDKILSTKVLEVDQQKSLLNLDDIKLRIDDASPSKGFINAIQERNKKGLVSVIAEIKKASPSKGIIREDFSPTEIAKQYETNGATCLSILTDEKYFQGSLDYLKQVRTQVEIPLLRKDFIVDEYQIYQSKLYGADCILLIVSALTDNQLIEYKSIAEELSLDVLVEVHNQQELERILTMNFSLIGINNRNLSTFEVSLETTRDLSSQSGEATLVSESGIRNKKDIEEILSYGVLNFLVGESFMRAEDPGNELKKLFFA